MQVGGAGRRRAPRVDYHDRHTIRVGRLASEGSLEQNGVSVRGVGTSEKEEVGYVEIVICTGRTITAESKLIRRSRAGHT